MLNFMDSFHILGFIYKLFRSEGYFKLLYMLSYLVLLEYFDKEFVLRQLICAIISAYKVYHLLTLLLAID